MKVCIPAFVLMAFATSQAIAAPAAEGADLEARAHYCVDIKVCHGYNWGGGCYKECKKPGVVHDIKKGYKENVGSIKIGTKGYDCQFGSNGQPGGSDGTIPVRYPGTKKLDHGWVNNLKEYYCYKMG